MKYCNQCGSQITEGSSYCNSCGAQLNIGGSPKVNPPHNAKPQAWPQNSQSGNQTWPQNNQPVNQTWAQNSQSGNQAWAQNSQSGNPTWAQNNQPYPNSCYPRPITPNRNAGKKPNSKLIFFVVSLIFVNLVLFGVLLFFILKKPADMGSKLTSKGESVTESSDAGQGKDNRSEIDGIFNKPTEAVTEAYTEAATEAYTEAAADYDSTEENTEVYSTGSKGVIKIWSYTDEVSSMVDHFLETHPDFGYEIENTIISTIDGEYITALEDSLIYDGADAPDLFCVEVDSVQKFTQGDMSAFACPYSELGIDVEAELSRAQPAPYTIDIGTNPQGQLVALSYLSNAGCFIYRRSIAKTVFGTDDPDQISQIIGGGSGNFDKFLNAAQALRGRGVSIISGIDDIWTVYKTNADKGWIVNGRLHIDSMYEEYMDFAKTLVENGYTNDTTPWSDEWIDDMSGTGVKPVFGYFGPAWFINYVMAFNCGGESIGEGTFGDWAVCEPPVGFFWGGSWLIANSSSDKKEAVGQIIDWMTLNCNKDGLQYLLANGSLNGEGGTKDSVPSNTVMDISDGTLDFLDGQDMFDALIPANRLTSGKTMTEYDTKINDFWQEQVVMYAHGAKDKNTAIADFKSQVSDQLGIQPE